MKDEVKEVKEVFYDLENYDLPANTETAFSKLKCELISGNIVCWYFKDDEEFAKENEFNVKDYPPYKGIIVPKPGITLHGDIDDHECIIVVISYPTEKENPYCEWVALPRLLDNPNLVEIYKQQ